MTRQMTAAEARAWSERWRAVEARHDQELIASSLEDRFAALASLMASAPLFDFRQLDEEDAVARALWAKLQQVARLRR
jgi:hypothetical protein